MSFFTLYSYIFVDESSLDVMKIGYILLLF